MSLKIDISGAETLVGENSARYCRIFPACCRVRSGIDSLKATVPIWKKEVYGEGDAPAWKENKEFKTRFGLNK